MKTECIFIGFAIGMMAMCVLLRITRSDWQSVDNKWEKEIVQRGYGKYVIDIGKTPPVVVFEWNVNTNK